MLNMNRFPFLVLCVGALTLLVACTARSAEEEQPAASVADTTAHNTLTEEERAEGWQLLFDGESLSEWRGFRQDDVPSSWQIEDGTLAFVPDAGEGGDIITREQFEDFELQLEWKISEGGNSGIIYNVSEDDEYDNTWETGPELQILDDENHPDNEDPTHLAGSNYDLHAPEQDVAKPAGEWNQVRLLIDEGHVEHWLNGEKIVEYELGSEEWNELVAESKFNDMSGYGQYDQGHIALQDHGDEVWFRNIKIRRIDD